MYTTLFGLIFVATIAVSLGLEVVPDGSVVNVGASTLNIQKPDGTEFNTPRVANLRVRDDGYMASATVYDPAGYSYWSSEFVVPAFPYDRLNNIIYYSHDVYTATSDEFSVLLTFYGDFVYPDQTAWSISVYGLGLTSDSMVVAPGSAIKALYVQSGNSWVVTAYVNGQVFRSITFAYNQTVPVTIMGSYLQVYNVEQCNRYPRGPLVTTNVVIKKGTTTVTNPTYQFSISTDQPSQCNVTASATATTITISYSTVNAPPTPTPQPLQYDYTCANNDVVYPTPSAGVLRSNPAGTLYGPNLNCGYGIIADDQNQRVRFDFSTFQFGQNGGGDVVKIYDAVWPDYNGAPLPLAFVRNGNGNSPMPIVITSGRYAYLEFTSDASGSFAGFVANYSYVTTVPSSVIYTCGPNMSYFLTYSSAGNIRSTNPAVNANYYNNMDCAFNITAPVGKKVSLSFTRFALAKTDSVKIYNGGSTSSPILAQYNTTAPTTLPKMTTTSNQAYFRFTTDAGTTAAGFNVYYSFV